MHIITNVFPTSPWFINLFIQFSNSYFVILNRYSEKEIKRAKQSADMAHAIAAHAVTLQTGITSMTGTTFL